MYKYQARLIKDKQNIAEGHTIQEVETGVRIYKKNNKDVSNKAIEIIHVKRDKDKIGIGKIEVVKII